MDAGTADSAADDDPKVATHSVSAQAPKAATEALVGTWTGPLAAAGNALTFVFAPKVDDKGNLQGSLTVPEQGSFALILTKK